ncbi:hypothetical protein DFR58_103211 [Anaerobacterium chartisolvens]|uniref:Plantaricin C family lantibiotic n=1 Tax=Anaerobacterium chartisolvens TaxID=1297424 RepID=A0A369BID9_9FIRM|nr:plantaricin C family lantibiotic [Anaerobacterium chartisolvens]RCX19464.1 hypothetical protein DFR58_103211 [Anaerobacterium chartisolvens]
MNFSKRNPLLRNNANNDFNNSVGSLGEEIQRQDLETIEGGSTPLCVIGTTILYTVTQTIATQVWSCGAVLTTSAECSRTGLPC